MKRETQLTRNGAAILSKSLLAIALIAGPMYGAVQPTCAFVNDNLPSGNTVEGYMVAGGSPVHLGPVATGGDGSPSNDHTFFATPLIALALGTTHLYATDSGSSDIAFFNINTSNCQPTLVADYPSGGSGIFGLGIAISPNGKFLYASNGARASTLTVLPINSDGSLGSRVQTLSLGAVLSTMVITPDGKTLIATQAGVTNQVTAYAVNQSTGKLKLASGVTTQGAADGVAIDSHSKFVYVGNGGDGGSADVQVIEIGTGSKLTYIADFVFNGIDNPADIPGSSNCLLLSPSGKLLYFSNQVEADVITLNVDPQSGTLSFNSVVNDGEAFVDEPSQLAMNPNGSLIFTGDFNSDGAPAMGILRTSSGGTLTLVGTFPLVANAPATSIAAGVF